MSTTCNETARTGYHSQDMFAGNLNGQELFADKEDVMCVMKMTIVNGE